MRIAASNAHELSRAGVGRFRPQRIFCVALCVSSKRERVVAVATWRYQLEKPDMRKTIRNDAFVGGRERVWKREWTPRICNRDVGAYRDAISPSDTQPSRISSCVSGILSGIDRRDRTRWANAQDAARMQRDCGYHGWYFTAELNELSLARVIFVFFFVILSAALHRSALSSVNILVDSIFLYIWSWYARFSIFPSTPRLLYRLPGELPPRTFCISIFSDVIAWDRFGLITRFWRKVFGIVCVCDDGVKFVWEVEMLEGIWKEFLKSRCSFYLLKTVNQNRRISFSNTFEEQWDLHQSDIYIVLTRLATRIYLEDPITHLCYMVVTLITKVLI